MAVTGFWPVYRNLKATLDYADNPDKTTLPEYLDEDLYAALRYAENDNKTELYIMVYKDTEIQNPESWLAL